VLESIDFASHVKHRLTYNMAAIDREFSSFTAPYLHRKHIKEIDAGMTHLMLKSSIERL